MKIAGFQPFTLSDYPGKVAAIVFTQGCNFRCPFCHNGSLIPNNTLQSYDESLVLQMIKEKSKLLDGVVVTGGEPTIQSDLPEFLQALKNLGLLVKLDTNGNNPGMVAELIASELVDYIAMDVKATPEKYSLLSGRAVEYAKIKRSMKMISSSNIDFEFRTTFVEPLLNEKDLEQIEKGLPAGCNLKVQTFISENALDANLAKSVVADAV